jgi:hypothetical protein
MVVVLISVALLATLVAHVLIDVLGDVLLAHDTYDDIGHASRDIVAFVTLALAVLGIAFALRAAVREARGSEDAFCDALRSLLPRNAFAFTVVATAVALVSLCLMEACDARIAGQPIDDVGDLFGGSIALGGGIVCAATALMGWLTLWFLRRLAQARIITTVVVAFLRRRLARTPRSDAYCHPILRLIYNVHYACRRIAGRAPPPYLFAVPR